MENKYKDSLNLPQTSFPMKAGLKEKEPEIINSWEGKNIYQKIQEKNKNSQRFYFVDGPPYANGNLHLGHVLNKVLKDMVVKYKSMTGFLCEFIPGWDCHGLPIELQAMKKQKEKLDAKNLRQLCRKEAKHWLNIQKDEFRRLGILADWDRPYLTLSADFEACELEVFAKIVEKDLIYRGEKPVFWCPKLQTALAQAEVEYQDHQSDAIYVKFESEDFSFVIWTTTPWTLPGNEGICLHPDLSYGFYESEKGTLVICEDLKEDFENKTKLKLKKIKAQKGKEFENLKAKHPFLNKTSLVILGSHVDSTAGTGCVHTAPSHGVDDYKVGLKYKLPLSCPVGPNGTYTLEDKELSGMHIWKANPFLIEKLKNSSHLIFHEKIKHSYPFNPRSQSPLIFRSTPQWFIKMDLDSFPLRKKALKAIEEQIKFVPDWGKQRLTSMIENSPDWCLSRQRNWGVPIPVFYCEKCSEPLLDPKLIKEIASKMKETEKGIDYYFNTETKELTKNQKCKKCSHTSFTKGTDILDVWFDSGITHSYLKQRDFPIQADLYLEGSDQHRGWFQTSLISALASDDKPAFKTLLTHGFVNDMKGFKMSKSKGNVIAPAPVIEQNGSEILRLWVAYEDYGQDVRVGDEIFKRIKESYRRFRNTFRFILGCLHDFDETKDRIEYEKLTVTDKWALHELYTLLSNIEQAYKSYKFHRVFHLLNEYVTVNLSATYLDLLKDRLYTFKTDSLERRSSQTVLYEILNHLTLNMAPVLSFLSEEVYSHFKNKKHESIFLETIEKAPSNWKNETLAESFNLLDQRKKQAYQKIDLLRKNKEIGSSLEVILTLKESKENIKRFEKINLEEFFIVSEVVLEESDSQDFKIEKSPHTKCLRCWNYFKQKEKEDICKKCEVALT